MFAYILAFLGFGGAFQPEQPVSANGSPVSILD